MKTIQEIFPIVKVKDSMILNGIGDITFGYRMDLPEAFTLEDSDYERMIHELTSVFSSLYEGCIITQVDDFNEVTFDKKNNYKSYTLRKNFQNLCGNPLLKHTSYIFISIPDKKINAFSSGKNTVFKLSNYLKNPFKEFPLTIKKAFQIKKEMDMALNSIEHIKAVSLPEDTLKEIIFKHWSSGEEYQKGSQIPEIRKSEGFLQIGEKYVDVISVVNHGELVQTCKKHKTTPNPDSKLRIESGFELKLGNTFGIGFNLPFNHTITRSILVASKDKMNIWFFFQKAREDAMAAIMSRIGAYDAEKRVNDIEGFQDAVSSRNYTYSYCSFNIIFHARTIKELEQKELLTKKELKNINEAEVYVEPYVDALPLWVASTPGYTRANYRNFVTVLEHALTYFTLESSKKGGSEGHLFVDRLGNPILIDLWNNKHINNRNGIVEGGSGTGKSFSVNNLVDQDLENGYHVIILDVGHSYKDQSLFHDGVYLDSSKLDSLSFNLFACQKDDAGNYAPDSDKILFIQSILITIWKGEATITNEENAILLDIIENYYHQVNKTKRHPSLIDFHRYLDEYHIIEERQTLFNKESFKTTLEPFTSGKYSHLLNADQGTRDLIQERFIVFDIESVAEDIILFPIVGLIIMEMVMDKIRRLPRSIRKRFIIDEGWKILKGSLSGFVEYLFRTFRKNEGSVFLASQAISDLPQNVGEDMAKALINNADILMLMKRGTTENYEDLQKYLSLSKFKIDMMKDLKRRDALGYREFFLGLGETASIIRLQSHKNTIATYSSKGDEKERIMQHFKRTGNIEYAINEYTEENIKLSYLKYLRDNSLLNEDQYKREVKLITLN